MTVSLFAIPCFKLPIVAFTFCAFCLVCSTVANACAWLIWLRNASRCGWFKSRNVSRFAKASCFACANFSSPFNASFAWFIVVTACVTVSGDNTGVGVPFAICCAWLAALLYACCLSWSACVKSTDCGTWLFAWICCFNVPIALFNASAFCLIALTPVTSSACDTWSFNAVFCGWFKFGNWSMAVFALSLATCKLWLPFKSPLAWVTCCNAWATCCGSTFAFGVPLMICSACATALLYAFCLSVSALTKLPFALVWSLSAIPCFNCVIAWFKSCAVCLIVFTFATVCAASTCCFNASFCAWFKSFAFVITCFAASFARCTLSLPFNACFASFTRCIACSTSVWLALLPFALDKIPSACATALV